MTISSRTPEGSPHWCLICGEIANVEYSSLGQDSLCPARGSILWQCRNCLNTHRRKWHESLEANTPIHGEIAADSLELVEFMMQVEDEFGIDIPHDDYEHLRTIGDVIRYVRGHRVD